MPPRISRDMHERFYLSLAITKLKRGKYEKFSKYTKLMVQDNLFLELVVLALCTDVHLQKPHYGMAILYTSLVAWEIIFLRDLITKINYQNGVYELSSI